MSSGPPTTGGLEPATQCLMIFVAVGEDGRPTPVPTLEPASMEERLLAEWAERRKNLRDQVQAAMERQTYSEAGTAPREVLRFLAAPTDINWGGKVHGGIVMRWIDEAAHVRVTRWAHDPRNVAVFTGGVRFYQPLRIGDLDEVEARLLHTGEHSVHVGVHVRSGDPATGQLALTTCCRTIFVVLDDDRRTARVPASEPVTAEDRALDSHATALVAIRERFGEQRTGGQVTGRVLRVCIPWECRCVGRSRVPACLARTPAAARSSAPVVADLWAGIA